MCSDCPNRFVFARLGWCEQLNMLKTAVNILYTIIMIGRVNSNTDFEYLVAKEL